MAKTRRKKSPSSKKATTVSYHKNSIWAEVRLVVLLVASLFLALFYLAVWESLLICFLFLCFFWFYFHWQIKRICLQQ